MGKENKLKTYEKICVEVALLDKVDIIRTSGEDEVSNEIGNGDTPPIPAI